jgi:subtilisin-like proprotein convertase family protein
MKTTFSALMLLAATCTRADVIIDQSYTPATPLPIPEGNPAAGVITTINVSGLPATWLVSSIFSVDLDISGGYNGDLYAYLKSPEGTVVTLLYQPGAAVDGGYGNPQPGLNITLTDSGATSIQNVPDGSGTLTGTYAPAHPLAAFDNEVVDGGWSLYVADVGSGGGSPSLVSWSLDIDAVPEPVNVALGIFSAVLLTGSVLRRGLRRSA